MKQSRRRFVKTVIASTLLPQTVTTNATAAQITPWHDSIAKQARLLNSDKALRILIPNGSEANISAATKEFTRLSGVRCIIEEVPVDEINIELILRASVGDDSVDVALPATFGLTDLVQAKSILALDKWAEKYEPSGFSDGYLYRKGDHYQGKLYGYQTDGDEYLMFYNKAMMEDPIENEAYFNATGRQLAPASSWEDLDDMMAFFQRPEEGLYGGSLFRNPGYLVWEWWARFHAKGYLPFTDDMRANINNEAGVSALEELIAATSSLSPGSLTNGLFDNWADFARGNVFCDIGWGGTQKYLMSRDNMRDNLIHSALPGPVIDGKPSTMGYFNWGWDYTVSTSSKQPELAYLLALFCATPHVSSLAVSEPEGFFDPFRRSHYEDQAIINAYGSSFLKAHRDSLSNSIPDLYISGQSNYMDALRQQILETVSGELSAKQALDICAQKWSHITRRLGKRAQTEQWQQLLATYPETMQRVLLGR